MVALTLDKFLSPRLTVTTVWNTGETGDIYLGVWKNETQNLVSMSQHFNIKLLLILKWSLEIQSQSEYWTSPVFKWWKQALFKNVRFSRHDIIVFVRTRNGANRTKAFVKGLLAPEMKIVGGANYWSSNYVITKNCIWILGAPIY